MQLNTSARCGAVPTAVGIDGRFGISADTSASGQLDAGAGRRAWDGASEDGTGGVGRAGRTQGTPAKNSLPVERADGNSLLMNYRITVSSRKTLKRRATASSWASSHSHSVSPVHPAAVNSSSWFEWRSTLRAIFARQYSELVFGRRLPRLQEWPCQKHP